MKDKKKKKRSVKKKKILKEEEIKEETAVQEESENTEEIQLNSSSGTPEHEEPQQDLAFVSAWLKNYKSISVDDFKPLDVFVQCIGTKTEKRYFDFKKSFYYALDTEEGKRELLIDIISLYNAFGESNLRGSDGTQACYLIFGVINEQEDPGVSNKVVGVRNHPDNREFAVLLSGVTPLIDVVYHQAYYEKKPVGLLEIRRRPYGPAYLRKEPGRLYTRVDGSNKGPPNVSEDLKKRVLAQFNDSFNADAWEKLSNDLDKYADCWRVLILTPPSPKYTEIEEYSKIQSLGYLKWHLVYDFDYSSRETGAFKLIEKTLINSAYVVPTTKVDTLAHPQYTNWLLLGGCSIENKKGLSGFVLKGKLGSNCKSFYDALIGNPRPVVYLALVLSQSKLTELRTLLEELLTAHMVAENDHGLIQYQLIIVCAHRVLEDALRIPDIVVEKGCFSISVVPLEQLCCGFERKYNGPSKDHIYVPGLSAPVTFPRTLLHKMEAYLTIFHIDCDESLKMQLDQDEHPENIINDIERAYCNGGELTIEALSLDVPVKRKEYKDLLGKIQNFLKRDNAKWFTDDINKQCVFRVYHDPSAGGTTCGRYILWSLHNQYPCVLIKLMQEGCGIVEFLKSLASRSYLPLVLLFDGTTTASVNNVRDQLHSSNTKVVVIHLIRNTHPSQIDQTGILELRAECIDKEDIANFRRLYEKLADQDDESKSLIRFQNRTPLFPLCAFLREFTQITNMLNERWEQATPVERNIIRLTTFMWQFTKQPLPYEIIIKIATPTQPITLGKKVLTHFSYTVLDLLIERKSEALGLAIIGLAPAVSCIIDLLQEKFGDTYIYDCIEDLTPLWKSYDHHLPTLKILTRYLFTNYRFGKDKHYTHLIETCKDKFGVELTAELFAKVVDIRDEPHIRAHYAKFLSYELNKHDEAIKQVRIALNPPGTTDVALHTMHASLLVNKLWHFTEYCRVSKDLDKTLAEAEEVVHQARQAFHHAQEDELNFPAFTGEAKCLYYYWKLYYEFKFHKSSQELRDFSGLQPEKSLLSTSTQTEIWERLDFLEQNLYRNQPISNVEARNPEEAQQRAFNIRVKLLKIWTTYPRGIIAELSMEAAKDPIFAASLPFLLTDKDNDISSLTPTKLRLIVNTLERRILMVPHVLRSDFYWYFKALLWQQWRDNGAKKVGLHQAELIIKRWKEKFLRDSYAYLYSYSVSVAMALEEENLSKRKDLLRAALIKQKECSEKCKDQRQYTAVHFLLSTHRGLKALAPNGLRFDYMGDTSNDKIFEHMVQKNMLKVFTGILNSNCSITSKDFPDFSLSANLPSNSPLYLQRDRQPEVKFVVKFSMKQVTCTILDE